MVVRCELLLGSYQAADPFAGGATAEWPPHPYRLHAALVFAACEAGGAEPDPSSIAALEWMEEQGPPEIECSEHVMQRTEATSWVPRNPTRGSEWQRYMKQGTAINRVGRSFPTGVPADPVIHFRWDDADAPPEAIAELVARVTYLGSSRSPVACALIDTPPAIRAFRPSGRGDKSVRIPVPGSTDAMLATRFVHPARTAPVIATYAFDDAARGQPEEADHGAFSELLIRRVVNGVEDIEDVAWLADALRLAVLSRAGDDAPAALHGHDKQRGHAAYLPLADVGHTAAGGSVRGVGLALPHDLAEGEREACLSTFAAVDRVTLPGRRALLLSGEVEDLATLSAERWVGPSADWASVTPVVLDRFPRSGRTALDELLASVANAGLPEPIEATVLAGPPVAGGALAGKLRGTIVPGQRVHARLRFAVPVRGPLAIGRGRFRGVGLFLPQRPA